MVLGAAGHAVGWPFPRGGTQRLSDALAAHLRQLGGTIETSHRVNDLRELPPARATMLDLTAWQAARVAGARLPARYRRRLEQFPAGPSIFKIDYALHGPIPWRAEACRRAGTVHLGGTLDEIALGERQVTRNEVPARPFVLLAQQSLFDPSRVPAGRQAAWAYCHIPFGCDTDMTDSIERQIERFAPGFRDVILARHASGPAQIEAANFNLVNGDISGGASNFWSFFSRPIEIGRASCRERV